MVSGRWETAVAIGLLLTSTAIGTLLPILKGSGHDSTPVGRAVLTHGAVGELGPILVMAVLLAMLARNVRRLSANLQETMYLAVPVRVARRLDELCDLFDGASIPLTQDDLAGLAGTTRQTVNQVLVELRDAGVVELGRGRVDVVDREALRRRSR